MRRKTSLLLLAMVFALVFAVAGCGEESGGGQEGEEGGEGGLAEREDIRLVMVTHGPADDPFHSVVKNGVDQAEEDLGVKVDYRAPSSFDIPEIQRNLESAIASEPDGIIISLADPDALGPTAQEATEQGIPTVVFNTGREIWEEVGALTYVGQTEYEAGVAAGERMRESGVTNALCINQEQGVRSLDQRCEGFAEGLDGETEQIAVDGSDPTAVENGVSTALRQNPEADGILTLGPQGADPTLNALEDREETEDLTFGTFDLTPSILQAVQNGEMLFAVDQQPFQQGYLPVVLLTEFVQYGISPVQDVPTGPTFVTQDNAEEVIELSDQGIR